MRELDVLAACCGPLDRRAMSTKEAERLAESLRVIADPARLRLLSLIASSPGSEACVCDLTEPVALSQPTVSHHLKVLQEAGLLEREQRGRWAYYRLRPRVAAALSAVREPAAAR